MNTENQNPNTVSSESTYPSVELAYEQALHSYDIAIQRSDAVGDTIDKLLTWFSGITIAVITIVATNSNLTAPFKSCWFYISIIIFLAIVILSVVSRIRGTPLMVVSPQELYEKTLGYSQWEFKKNAIYWASQHFIENCRFVTWKAKIAKAMSWLFIVEIITLTVWLISLDV